MAEYADEDFVPDDFAEEIIDSLEEAFTQICKDISTVKVAHSRLGAWFGAQRMTYGEFVQLRNTARFLHRAVETIEDAAASAETLSKMR
jgi:hypothetical protein